MLPENRGHRLETLMSMVVKFPSELGSESHLSV